MLESKREQGCKKTSAHQLGDKTSTDFEEVSRQKLLERVIVSKGSDSKPDSCCTSKQPEKALREHS